MRKVTVARGTAAAVFALAQIGGVCTPAEVQQARADWDARHERMLAHLPGDSWHVTAKSYHGERMGIWLDQDAVIAGVPCHGEVELTAGRLSKATLAAAHREGRSEFPKGTQLSWGHPNGAPGLIAARLSADTLVDQMPCAAWKGGPEEIRFDEAGNLLWCRLAADLTASNPDCVRGASATFSAAGVTCSRP